MRAFCRAVAGRCWAEGRGTQQRARSFPEPASRSDGISGERSGGIRLANAAKYLGRDLNTLSVAVKKLQEKMQTDTKLYNDLQELCARMRKGRQR